MGVISFKFVRCFHCLFQIKGVGELLEGLIPYSQRHFSRIDRLVRSTYLLDYTLMGMSVIEPEPSSTKPDVKNQTDVPMLENAVKNIEGASDDRKYTCPVESVVDDEDEGDQIQTLAQLQDRSAKKRKTQKSQRSSTKKSKSLGLVDAGSISLQA